MMDDFDDGKFSSNRSSIGGWIFFFIASLLCLLIFVWVSPKHDFSFLFGDDEVAKEKGEKSSKKKTKKRRKKARKGKKRRGRKVGIEGDDYVYNDIEFGDIGQESEPAIRPTRKLAPLPPPPKSLWNPSSSYRPKAEYREKNTTTKIITKVNFDGGNKKKKRQSASLIRSKLHAGKVMSCYNTAVQKAPKMKGRVDIKGTIEPDGHISFVKVTRSGLYSRSVESCIIKKLRRVSFPKVNSATKFSTHFSFSSR